MSARHGGRRPGSGRRPIHPEGRTTRLIACVPQSLVQQLDAASENRKCSRSSLVTEALRRYVRSFSNLDSR